MMSAANVIRVDPSNAEQARAWDGDEGAYWAGHAEQFDRAVAAYHGPFLAAAAIGPSDNVLDIGCGTGQTTRDAARIASSGSALGLDLSSRMIDVARRLAHVEGPSNARFEQADAQIHPLAPESFDAAISRTGAMFFGDPVAAFANVASALRPGAGLTMLAWQAFERNEWVQELIGAFAVGRDLPVPPPDAAGPFSLADPDRVRALLAAAGYEHVTLEPVAGQMHFGPDAAGAHRFVHGLLGWMLEDLDESERTRALGALDQSVRAHERDDGVFYDSRAWIIRARRA
jgi:SAM-dependent methyltransferase